MQAAHVDAYADYNLLVGESDGGSALPQKKYDALIRKAIEIHENGARLYVFWRNIETSMDCHTVGGSTRCSCLHTYKSHAWYATTSKKVRCRVPGCKCPCFDYITARGSRFLRCDCKHENEDHLDKHNRKVGCQKNKCACAGFRSSWKCDCGGAWELHQTVFDTRDEREAMGRPVENLARWTEHKKHLEAACGGVTRFSSLVHGVDRLGENLIAENATVLAARGGSSGAGSSSGGTIAGGVCGVDGVGGVGGAGGRVRSSTQPPSPSRPKTQRPTPSSCPDALSRLSSAMRKAGK
jgi:hypothetical protein